MQGEMFVMDTYPNDTAGSYRGEYLALLAVTVLTFMGFYCPQPLLATVASEAQVSQPAASLLPVADVACACGFNDPNYFSRVFARIMGIPPSEYRRRFLDIETRQPPPQAR